VGYEVLALRYASAVTTRDRHFYNHEAYAIEDGPHETEFFFWLIRDSQRVVLLDCGFDRERGAKRGNVQSTSPLDLLKRHGVSAADVEHVVLSHMHYDHVGNIALFPNATFSLARAEYEYWTGPTAGKTVHRRVVDDADIDAIQRLDADGRVLLFGESLSPYLGIHLVRVGGHTPGQILMRIEATSGEVVLASDAAHFYEEFQADMPFRLFHHLDEMYGCYETLRTFERKGGIVVPGHDPLVMDRFERMDADCWNLCRPVTD
jgi:glyoxylase-like metal-dependent hydrolase (beta-lactamase superfamily II)